MGRVKCSPAKEGVMTQKFKREVIHLDQLARECAFLMAELKVGIPKN
jgi:hypothetical protein